jgi:hypothetical protein
METGDRILFGLGILLVAAFLVVLVFKASECQAIENAEIHERRLELIKRCPAAAAEAEPHR